MFDQWQCDMLSPRHEGHIPLPARLPRARLRAALPEALANGEITVCFQPKVSLDTGALIGVEALARWNSSALGPVPPIRFIPVAEQLGLIGALTHRVLEAALASCRRMREHHPCLTVAVNFSPILLTDPDLPDQIARALDQAGLAPDVLIAEITESRIITDPFQAGVTLGVLRARGVGCSIDDFGTGHASLLSLLRLPFSELKIDRAFIAGCAEDGEAEKIVRATLGLAREMQLNVVAEGIETLHTETMLRALGCRTGQGFRYGRAMTEGVLMAELQPRVSA